MAEIVGPQGRSQDSPHLAGPGGVVHELLHLKVPNRGKVFRGLL